MSNENGIWIGLGLLEGMQLCNLAPTRQKSMILVSVTINVRYNCNL